MTSSQSPTKSTWPKIAQGATLLLFFLLFATAACGGSPGGSGSAAEADAGPTDCAANDPSCTPTCPNERACGETCCDAGGLCLAGTCTLDCGAKAACGEGSNAVCCGDSEVCYRDGCVVPGDSCNDVYECGAVAYCETTLGQCLPIPDAGLTCLAPTPAAGDFTPQIGWKWTSSTIAPAWNQVMMTPAVANLTDDNGDGLINELDIPDVVFHTFHGSAYGSDGIMRAVSGDTGVELWSIDRADSRVVPGSSIAIADIDEDGKPEILACGTAVNGLHPLLAFENDGTLKWASTNPAINCGYAAPAVANVDQGGPPEILVRYSLVNADGSLRWRARDSGALFTSLYDIDGDGYLDIVGGNAAYDRYGTEIWSRPDYPDGYNAIGDLDGDGKPDVVLVDGANNRIMAFRGSDGADLWPSSQDVNQGRPTPSGPSGGGPPTIADFDGDGKAEVAVAGGYGYVVYEGEDGAPKWFQSTIDLSSRVTGSSVFDFEDDGLAEVLYADERQLHIYRGTDGTELFSMCNSSGTLWEYPLVVDVDNDEAAEIIVARNNYAFSTCLDGTPAETGIAMIEDASNNWTRTRRIWNQHTYHVTNIDEDGRVPMIEANNWEILGLNNFRQNVQPIAVRAAADLVVTSVGKASFACPMASVEARVKNIGDAGAPAGVSVEFFLGDLPNPTYIGSALTSETILPGGTTLVSLAWDVPSSLLSTALKFYAVVDHEGSGEPAQGTGSVGECDETNNVSAPYDTLCPSID